MAISLFACIKEFTFGHFKTDFESFEVPRWSRMFSDLDSRPGLYERVDAEYLGKVRGLILKSMAAPKDIQRFHRTVQWYEALRETFETGVVPGWWSDRPWFEPPWPTRR